MHFQKVILPNDKILDFETLLPFIQKSDLLFCFGQKNGLKDKVCLEVVANEDGNSIPIGYKPGNGEAETEAEKSEIELK